MTSDLNRPRNFIHARCIYRSGKDLGAPARPAIHSIYSEFDEITVGKQYRIYGMEMWESVIAVLIANDYDQASWLPIGLFEIPNQAMPPDWKFSLVNGPIASGCPVPDGLDYSTAIRFGYAELVDNPNHSIGLIDEIPDDIRKFNTELVKPLLEDWE